jgi:hypothetical protein
VIIRRPVFALQVRPEPGVTDVIRALRSWLKQGPRAHGLRCMESHMASKPKKLGIPTREGIDDVWQRRATAAAIVAVRQVVNGGTIPSATSIGRLTDIELGWLFASALFAWIRTRAEQAATEGSDTELALRMTALEPQPWDAGAVESVLPQIAEIKGIDWDQPVGAWSKDAIVRFLIGALRLVNEAMIARDIGGGVSTQSKSLDEMQRIGSAEAGGSLATPDELNDALPW